MAEEMAGGRARGPRRALVQGGAVLAVIVVALVVIGVIAHARAGADTVAAAPTGWQDGSAPTSQPLASYAVSHLTPGLIVGIVGGPTGQHLSADPLGSARVWRSRDGGAHWQAIATNYTFMGGATITFISGSDMLAAVDGYNAASSTPYLISQDDGGTWQKLPASPANGTTD